MAKNDFANFVARNLQYARSDDEAGYWRQLMEELVLAHSESCSSVVVRSHYDTSCPRCAIINKVIMLRRKRTALGCSWSEQQTAESVAQAIISKHDLAHAECIDRLYVKQEAIAKGERPVPQRRSGSGRRNAMDKAAAFHAGFVDVQHGEIVNDL